MFVNATESRGAIPGVSPPVEVYLGVYPRQDANHRLVAYRNSFVPVGWRALGRRRTAVPVGGAAFDVLELEGFLDRRRRLVWGWFWVAGEPATGPLEAKLLELKGLLAGRRDAVAVAVSTECAAESCDEARRRLADVVNGSMDSLRWNP